MKLKNKKTKQETGGLITIPDERIASRIYYIRGKKVMFDNDLAELYKVETKALNRAVKRNIDRFPDDFVFRLNEKEFENLRFHFGTSSYGGRRYAPLVFTEQGVAMLSAVLRSKRAVAVSIQIVRTFVKLRQMLSTNKELRQKIEALERKYNGNFKVIFKVIGRLLKEEVIPKEKIGFKEK